MNKKPLIFFTSAALLLFPLAALAFDAAGYVVGILTRFLNWVVWPVFIGATLLMLIYAGFMFVTSRGDPSKIKAARDALIWAVIGIIVVIFAYSAVGFVTSIIGTT